jgi:sugar lactone lactonase YvrE
MKKFWGYVSNNDFSVGCTGQTVFLYDKDGNELGKFKDIIYGYTPMISPDGTLFIIKSTDGRLAVYSLETFSLIKKFRFSKVDGAQDDGFCFSPEGKFFINIERQKDDLHSAISVYDTTDFSLTKQILLGEDMMLQTPERGDILAMLVTGAYQHSMASNYNKIPRLPLVMVKDGASRVVVRRETYEDLLSLDVF